MWVRANAVNFFSNGLHVHVFFDRYKLMGNHWTQKNKL